MNLKKKIYLDAYSTPQRCPKEIMKIFLIEDFSICLCTLSSEYLCEFSKNLKQPYWYNQGLGGN
jgi:hypothetical protein